jgi:tetratricopeptide (TPR) repeat protein
MMPISVVRRRGTYLFLSYLAAITLCSAVRVHAQGRESAEIILSRAVLLYDDKKYDEATRELMRANQLDPRNTNVIYYLALSLSAQGRHAEAEAVVRKGLEVQPKNPSLRLMLASTLRAQGKSAAAREVAETVQLDPASPIVGPSRDLLTSLRTPRRGNTPFWFEATARVQYDSNVSLEADNAKRTPGLGSKSSGGNLLAVDTEYAFFQTPRWQSAVRYDFLQTLNYQNHQFDFNENTISARLTYNDLLPTGHRYFVTARGFYDNLLEGGQKFLERPTGILDSFLYWDDVGSNRTQLLYQFQYHNFRRVPSGDENRDAFNYRVGIVHYIFFDHQRYAINFGYHYDFNDALGQDWEYAGHRAIAGFLVTLPWDVRATTNFEFHARHYNGVNSRFTNVFPFNNVRRNDHETIALFSLAKDITPSLTVSLEHLWNKNQSSIAAYDYTRHVSSLGLTWRYY